MAEWVSFAELRGRVSMENILGHYGLIGNLKPQKGAMSWLDCVRSMGRPKGASIPRFLRTPGSALAASAMETSWTS